MVLHFAILHAGASRGALSSRQLQHPCHTVHSCTAPRVQAAARCGAHMPDVAAVSAHLSAMQVDCLALPGVSGLTLLRCVLGLWVAQDLCCSAHQYETH